MFACQLGAEPERQCNLGVGLKGHEQWRAAEHRHLGLGLDDQRRQLIVEPHAAAGELAQQAHGLCAVRIRRGPQVAPDAGHQLLAMVLEQRRHVFVQVVEVQLEHTHATRHELQVGRRERQHQRPHQQVQARQECAEAHRHAETQLDEEIAHQRGVRAVE